MAEESIHNQQSNQMRPTRKLKKIKRLVKKPLPKPLPAESMPLPPKNAAVTDNLSTENIQSSFQQHEKTEFPDHIINDASISNNLNEQQPSVEFVSDTSAGNDTANIDILSDFSVNETVFASEPIQTNNVDKNLDLSSQNLQTEISPDSPDFLEDSADFTLPAIQNTADNNQENNDFSTPRFIQEQDIASNDVHISFIQQLKECDLFTKKAIAAFSVAALIVGLFMGKLMFGTSTVVRNGLSGVVANPEVPKGRARCGVAEKTQGCVLYLMNPQRQDLNARDFYDLASQLTGRQRFVIETGNMRYSNVRISPGEIAQFNIPPLQ